MKDAIITFKVDPELKADFEKYCKSNYTTPSHELRLFVHNRIKASGNKLTLQELNHAKSKK